ncbi:MAG: hypothetical protein Q7T87_16860 [Polaromonas sp.]|nr:hypothetical protein [Polaromonas sp.]
MANDLRLGFVFLVGTADVPPALQGDAHINSRFLPVELTRWQASDDFRLLPAAIGRIIALRRASDLGQRPIVASYWPAGAA